MYMYDTTVYLSVWYLCVHVCYDYVGLPSLPTPAVLIPFCCSTTREFEGQQFVFLLEVFTGRQNTLFVSCNGLHIRVET